MKVLLQHGWGYSADRWATWLSQLKGISSFHCPSRGYFHESSQSPAGVYDLLITHSLGLHLLPSEVLNRSKALWLISPFRQFLGSELQQQRLRRRWLQKMRNKLRLDPNAVLRDFRQACGDPLFSPEATQNIELLIQDLDLLEHSHIDQLPQVPTWITHGTEDLIVPLEYSEELMGNGRIRLVLTGEPHLPSQHSLDRLWYKICRSLKEKNGSHGPGMLFTSSQHI